ncbi:glycoside hydrolase family 5 protein [Aestuariimicrobium sp. T2.26MG-19.2B]|uniref:glycoside hydrolase family 5 protein n=1 Tax=Aestuariimicrobium sp. T2.26MG-19.2B TaxID=3040679 RepID=UPI0024775C4A|nr:cellulase family glycosylhydrolase [Aestuariimicrobium sp. T2.26MG-19.2B]CAI9405579.1 hypothetical protein AESSP_01442 [Aestuariimicrobium sp. T2.26MG-19.2B]
MTPHQFVRRDHQQLLGPDGRPHHFRGVGIGNWLLVEGYMWGFFEGATRPRLMEAELASLAGEGWAGEFWPRFRDAFFTEADVAAIADAGFDHLRVPFNWRLFMDESRQLDDPEVWLDGGFTRLQQVVAWCGHHGLLVLFDLHGAPGGQTGSNIDDSEHDRPEVFEEPHRSRCIALWTEIARRFADEPVVMGYDLLNEPCRDEFQHQHAGDLVSLYRDLTAAIRSVDRNHLLMYEGSHWATNFSIFDEVWDDNSCLQFHRYWEEPDLAGLDKFRQPAARLDLPLYMGEGGENTPEWLRQAFGGYDELGISWNFWPWKKLATQTSPADAPAPPGWDEIVSTFSAVTSQTSSSQTSPSAPVPDRQTTRMLFDQALEAFRLENCRWRPEIVEALLPGSAVTPAASAE